MRINVDPIAVKAAIAAYLEASAQEPPEAVAAARQCGVLPFWKDMGGCLLLRPDGEILTFGWDTPNMIEPLAGTRHDREVLHRARGWASRRFPGIRGLAPERGAGATTCPGCNGTGKLLNVPESIICQCGGLGWLPGDLDRGAA
jgi:hypothetical protein